MARLAFQWRFRRDACGVRQPFAVKHDHAIDRDGHFTADECRERDRPRLFQ